MLVDVVELSKNKCAYSIKAKLKYATRKNFLGLIVDGYDPDAKDFALMTPIAAEKLCAVQNHLIDNYRYGLLIYDSYRPKRAVRHFMLWSTEAHKDTYELERKEKHYPNVEKNQFFDLGYVAEDSGHCYGNTVDLVLIDISTGNKLPMGTRFDYMDVKSHVTATADVIGEKALQHRNILAEAMIKFGFQPYQEEYWHFSHGGASGRETQDPLDIPITTEMRGLRS